jgi:hypothetical protein
MTGENVSGRSEPRLAGEPVECDVIVSGADDGRGGLIIECEPSAGAVHWRTHLDGRKHLDFLTRVVTDHVAAYQGGA